MIKKQISAPISGQENLKIKKIDSPSKKSKKDKRYSESKSKNSSKKSNNCADYRFLKVATNDERNTSVLYEPKIISRL